MNFTNTLDGDDFAEIRRGVRSVCDGFPAEYWREKDQHAQYPTEFVQALTDAGYLAALIPEAYGGSGLSLRAAAVIMEEMQAAGCNGSACH
ncbi:MAG: acyl-CoA dehydrogenase family protein, partial [Pseudomonadota bacterium]